MLSLTVAKGPDRGAVFELRSPARVVIGRNSPDLKLNDIMISRYHARIKHEGNGWTVRDLGSRNGTKLNGHRLLAPTELKTGDRIVTGYTEFEVALLPDEVAARPAAAPPALASTADLAEDLEAIALSSSPGAMAASSSDNGADDSADRLEDMQTEPMELSEDRGSAGHEDVPARVARDVTAPANHDVTARAQDVTDRLSHAAPTTTLKANGNGSHAAKTNGNGSHAAKANGNGHGNGNGHHAAEDRVVTEPAALPVAETTVIDSPVVETPVIAVAVAAPVVETVAPAVDLAAPVQEAIIPPTEAARACESTPAVVPVTTRAPLPEIEHASFADVMTDVAATVTEVDGIASLVPPAVAPAGRVDATAPSAAGQPADGEKPAIDWMAAIESQLVVVAGQGWDEKEDDDDDAFIAALATDEVEPLDETQRSLLYLDEDDHWADDVQVDDEELIASLQEDGPSALLKDLAAAQESSTAVAQPPSREQSRAAAGEPVEPQRSNGKQKHRRKR